jgi:hypothetical protein
MIMRGLLDDPTLRIRRYRSAIEGLHPSFETRSSPVQLHEWLRERYSHQNVLSALKVERSAAILLIVDRECVVSDFLLEDSTRALEISFFRERVSQVQRERALAVLARQGSS